MSELTAPSMHDARDAEDRRLLEAGDYQALVEAYYGVILQRCVARTGREDEALEVASDVAERLLGELKAGKTYSVPFRVVVHNVIGWKLNEHFNRRSRDGELGEGDAPDDGGYQDIDDGGGAEALLDGLPGREGEVARLRILGGLDPEEIAQRLGISRNNVDQAWHRAKHKLREALEAQ